MATESKPAPKPQPDAESPKVSAEGVPYQSSGFEGSWRDEVNEGPFDEGEGKNSPLLKANQEAAAEREAELAEAEKTYKTGRAEPTK